MRIPNPSLGVLTTPFLVVCGLCSRVPEVPPVEDGPAQEQQDPNLRRTERFLTLRDGRIVRGHCRLVEGRWELERNDRVLAIPAESVTQVIEGKKLMRELAQRRKQIRPSDHEGRLQHLEWMVAVGLTKESLSTFDKILARSPDEPRALDLLSRLQYSVSIPIQGPLTSLSESSLIRLLHYAGSSRPTVQEKIVSILRDYENLKTLRALLGKLLFTGLERPRAFATLALRRMYPGAAQKELLGRAVLDRSKKVRTGAALALAKVEEPGILVPVVRAMSSEHKLVRMYAAEAIGNMGHKEGLEPLIQALVGLNSAQSASSGIPPASNIDVGEQIAYAADYDIEIAQGASISDPKINAIGTGSAFTARSMGISGYSLVRHKKTLIKSLAQLSGENIGKRPKDWIQWWESRPETQRELKR